MQQIFGGWWAWSTLEDIELTDQLTEYAANVRPKWKLCALY